MSQQITERVLDRKRHTVGIVIDGTQYTRLQTIRLAKRGEVQGVRVCKGPQGPYLSSTTDTSLYSLPTRVAVQKARRTAGTKRVAAKTATGRKTTPKATRTPRRSTRSS